MPSFYAPTVPGITDRREGDRASPSLLTALREPDPKKKVALLLDVAKDWFDDQTWYYREAVESLAFYSGAQWGYWSDRESRYISKPEPRSLDQVRLTIPAIKPVVDQATALLTQESPIFGAAAAKDEAQDSAASEAANSILDYYWRQYRLVELYRDSARDALVTGTVPILVEWDSAAGAQIVKTHPDPMTGAPVPEFTMVEDPTAPEGFKVEPARKRQGDLKFTMLMREQVAFEPGAKRDTDGLGVCILDEWLDSDLRHAYPEKFNGEDGPEAGGRDDGQHGDYERAKDAERSSPMGRGSASGSDAKSGTKKRRVYTFYVPSCDDYPLGKMIRVTEGYEPLVEEENPVYPKDAEPDELWPRQKSPVFFVRCDNRTTSPWGRGRVVDAIGPQRALNGVVSKFVQHVATIANTKITLPKGLDEEWDDQIGQVLRLSRLTPPGQIGYLTPPNLPQEFLVGWERLKGEIEYIFGINSATLGQAPTSDASGRLVQKLQGQDMGRIAPVKRSIDQTWGEIMRYSLFLFRRHADEKRKILVVGENDQVSVQFFDRSDLAAGTDVLVFNDQSVPRDPAQRGLWLQQFTQTLQMVQEPNWRRMLMRMYRVKDFEGFLEDLDPDEQKARRLCQLIVLGQPIYVTPADDPLAMKADLERWTKSREFELLVARQQKEAGGWSKTEAYAMQVLTYYTQVASQIVPPFGPAFMPPPEAPMAPAMPGMPMPGAGAPPMGPPGMPPASGGAPPAMPEATPMSSAPQAPVGAGQMPVGVL